VDDAAALDDARRGRRRRRTPFEAMEPDTVEANAQTSETAAYAGL
jgi:hypothetical protein